ncbi:MAG: ribonuclease HII [Opitutales bacterium]|jgi:ribonuclease HII
MPLGLVGFDRRELGEALSLVGVDEAGRGCLVGPVVAAAVRCSSEFYASSWCRRNSRQVDDSKRLPPARRAEIVERFKYACSQDWIQIGIGVASVEEIERYNIYHANGLAMRRALDLVAGEASSSLWDSPVDGSRPPVVIIDGRPIRNFAVTHRAIVKGDRKSLAIALAGIHAKEHRDAIMRQLDLLHPRYGFGRHKGYGTAEHMEALRRHGPCPEHRPSFLHKVMGESPDKPSATQDSLF